MTILYSLVARDSSVLAEHTEQKGNFQKISKQILEKISSRNNTKVSYVYDNYVFHILVQDGITYFCMSEKDFGNRIPFAFLEEVRKRYTADNTSGSSLSRLLKEQMTQYSDRKNDKMERIKDQVTEVKQIMVDNIDKVLDRGEKIELLVDRTADLSESAQNFKFKSKKLKNAMFWKNIKIAIILIILILLVIAVIVWIACGITFQNCIPRK